MHLTGKIINILANFYHVQDSENKVWECFARGRLLKAGKLLFVGDVVEIEKSNSTQGVIVDVCNRKNKIIKPPIANVDEILIIFSTSEPEFDFYNLDRYLSYISYELPEEKKTICINKIDLKKIDINKVYEKSAIRVFYISALTGEGIEKLADEFTDKTVVLTGPSGVGKSSLIKVFMPEEDIKIGDISSIKQGKHTTRNVQLIPVQYKSRSWFLADTPGFTQFSFAALNPYKILSTFKELNGLNCSFDNCLHGNEEGCVVRYSIENGEILESRYNNYLQILDESKSEIKYGTKEESKFKEVGTGKNKGKKVIPKLDQILRSKSKRKQRQDLQKFDDES